VDQEEEDGDQGYAGDTETDKSPTFEIFVPLAAPAGGQRSKRVRRSNVKLIVAPQFGLESNASPEDFDLSQAQVEVVPETDDPSVISVGCIIDRSRGWPLFFSPTYYNH
jgi:hypothetical protein